MAQFTNTAPGARGVTMKGGSTVLIEAGATAEINKTDIAVVHPDIEEGAKAARDAAKADDAE